MPLALLGHFSFPWNSSRIELVLTFPKSSSAGIRELLNTIHMNTQRGASLLLWWNNNRRGQLSDFGASISFCFFFSIIAVVSHFLLWLVASCDTLIPFVSIFQWTRLKNIPPLFKIFLAVSHFTMVYTSSQLAFWFIMHVRLPPWLFMSYALIQAGINQDHD